MRLMRQNLTHFSTLRAGGCRGALDWLSGVTGIYNGEVFKKSERASRDAR